MPGIPFLGVVICTFNSSDVILDCLESLMASTGVELYITIVDNASTDGTVELIKSWASGEKQYTPPNDCPFSFKPIVRPQPIAIDGTDNLSSPHKIKLVESGINGGFASGVNIGLSVLYGIPHLERFWVLNPDSMVPADCASNFANFLDSDGFSLIGGRVLYLETPDQIQMDGGVINFWTGVTGNLNLGLPIRHAREVSKDDFHFVSGASMVASRSFYEEAGPIPEDYFLYYEEVDWALRRGPLPLAYCPEAIVYHRAGTSIGSPTLDRPASPFSLYFKHRARMRFMRRYYPWGLPTALLYSLAKAGQVLLKGYPIEAWTIISASIGLPPSRQVRNRLSPEAQKRAF